MSLSRHANQRYVLPTPFQAVAGTKYWLRIEASQSVYPDWGIAVGTGGDGQHYQFSTGLAMFNNAPNDAAFTLLIPGSVNSPPVLAAISDQTAIAGNLLTFTIDATDPDLPAQTLSFSIDPGYPTGASITPGGVFSWTPTASQAPSTNLITVRVTDNGVPPLSATTNFTVVVSALNLTIRLTVTNTVVVSWPSSSTGYILRENPALGTVNWVNSTNAMNVVGGQNQVIIETLAGSLFYRLISSGI